MTHSSKNQVTRRRFIQAAGAGVAMFHIVPASVLGKNPPSGMLRVACIGIGGRGAASVHGCKENKEGTNIIGLCDVDAKRGGKAFNQFPGAKQYKDYRVMLDELDDKIDVVTVGTPDHTHAVAAIDAIKRGKHVYCEKPLAHDIREIRALMAAAKEHQVVTQLGNQGHSFDSIRLLVEWYRAGAIGKVREVHLSCDALQNTYNRISKLPTLKEKHDIPDHLDWDLWQGPALERNYNPDFLPWNWRGWAPYGAGCLGDWFCHVADPTYWALDLDYPTSVTAKLFGDYDPVKHAMTFPPGAELTYEFPAKGSRGPVTVKWFQGTRRAPRPGFLGKDRKTPGTGGILYGENNTGIMHGSHGAGGCRVIPETRMKEFGKNLPPKSIPRAPGNNHHQDFMQAIKTGKKAGSDFVTYGGPLTEVALLGVIAMRFPGVEMKYDAKAARITNHAQADALINPPYRQGWSL